MADSLDYELLKTAESHDTEQAVRTPVWIAAVLALIATAFGAYWFYGRSVAPAPSAPAARTESPPAPARALGGNPEAIVVPSLDNSDPVVRELMGKITSHPSVLAWLATNGLIRNFTTVVDNVVQGVTPSRILRVLRPSAPFRVVQRDGALFIDAKSYDRYDGVAAAVASIDPAGAARVYATLKPRIQEAYGELGLPPGSFDSALERAIVSLLQTPAVSGPVRVETKGGIAYRYADPKLENLTAAQKHLLRTGPRNVQVVQSALRAIAIALGIPPARLPAARP